VKPCVCCGKTGHAGRKCPAPFKKRWPGKPAIKLLVRTEQGNEIEMISPLSPATYDQAMALWMAICKDAS
jgi:hypothetical protein